MGQHFTRVTPDRSSPEFADCLLEIAEHYAGADTIHLVNVNVAGNAPAQVTNTATVSYG